MPQGSASDLLVEARADAHALAERTRCHQIDIQTLAAAAERDLLSAREALACALGAPQPGIERVRQLFRVQLQQREDSAETARRLVFDVQDHQCAIAALVARLENTTDAAAARAVAADAVLVVDDFADVRDLAALILRDAGFHVVTATNGVEALLKAHELRPLVIVMDVNMPILDGLEATRLLKATATTRHARVIAYTGDPSFDSRAADALFAAVLRKPAPPDVVVATVREVAAL
jgi:CheY-like chemotaxis protein